MKLFSLRWLNPLPTLHRAARALANWRKRRHDLDYVMISLDGAIPALPESRSWVERRLFGTPVLSIWDIDQAFRRATLDQRPKGVILFLRDPEVSLADVQTLRGIIERMRAAGKTVIAYAQTYDLTSYLIASACNRILMQPGGDFAPIGLFQRATFLKDVLAQVGVSLDVVAITPYKGAFDQLSRSEVSAEGREQIEWLLDSRYTIILEAIAASRGKTVDQVREMIDTAPHLDIDALTQGYIDGLAYEENLPGLLESTHLIDWDEAERLLFIPTPPPHDPYVAVLPITGMMMSGESGGSPVPLPIDLPFVGEETAGDQTIVQQVRALINDESAEAVVLFIDSGGGAASAAEAMASALDELAKTRPVVAYMNGVAASGGYMVACPAQWIVAQPGTITGSIGVVSAKPVTGELETMIGARSILFKRGLNADLFDTSAPFTESGRAVMFAQVKHSYQQFIERVARARKQPVEAIDAVGGGRVWTGVQALEHGLVDQLGDLRAAVAKARELADLPDQTPAILFESDHRDVIAPIAAKVDPAGWARVIKVARAIGSGRSLALMPFEIRRKG